MGGADQTSESSFLKQLFSRYYKDAKLELPPRFGRREWGFMFIGERFMKRHISFSSAREVKSFLIGKGKKMGDRFMIPSHAYHSVAYYTHPNAKMDKKGWLGADLVFDLDADHIPGAEEMTYSEQLGKVKVEFIRLVEEFLLQDFGFKEKEIKLTFSGGRGYHAHVRATNVPPLSSHDRREIVDYIEGKGLREDWLFPKAPFGSKGSGRFERALYRRSIPTTSEQGWKGRIAKGISEITLELEEIPKEEAIRRLMTKKRLGKITAEGIYEDLFSRSKGKRGIDKIREDSIIEVFSKDKYREEFLDIVMDMVRVPLERKTEVTEIDLAGEMDEPVTTDIRRLIRMSTSLHGKTCLRVTPLVLEELKDFEPLRDAVVFSDDPVKINVSRPYEIGMMGEQFNLKEGEVEVPEYLGAFLIGQRIAVFPDGEAK